MTAAVKPTAGIRNKILSAAPPCVWGIAILAVAIRVIHSLAIGYTSEDYLITLRYVDNLAAGHGFVYNAGERVLGTTTPLYTLLLAGIKVLGLSPTAIGKTLNILADGALCVIVYRWLDELKDKTAGIAAALFLALNPILIRWSTSGMETSLVTLVGAVALLSYARRRDVECLAWLGLLFWLRWDSLLLTVTLTIAMTIRSARIPWRELGLFAVVVAPWILFAWAYFGSPVPVTAASKMAVYGWRAHGNRFPQLGNLAYRFGGNPVYASILLLALLGTLRAWRRRYESIAPAIAWFVMYFAAFLYSRMLMFEWYLAPPLPVYAVLCALGIAGLCPERLPRIARYVAWCSLAVAGIAINVTLYSHDRSAQAIEENLRIPIGIWLRENTSPTDTVMLEPIGYIGYYSQRRVLDTIGLVSPEVTPYWRESSFYPMYDIALAFKPEWVLLRPGELNHVQDAARAASKRWEDAYDLVKTFTYARTDREPVTFVLFRRRPRSP